MAASSKSQTPLTQHTFYAISWVAKFGLDSEGKSSFSIQHLDSIPFNGSRDGSLRLLEAHGKHWEPAAVTTDRPGNALLEWAIGEVYRFQNSFVDMTEKWNDPPCQVRSLNDKDLQSIKSSNAAPQDTVSCLNELDSRPITFRQTPNLAKATIDLEPCLLDRSKDPWKKLFGSEMAEAEVGSRGEGPSPGVEEDAKEG